MTVLEGNLVDGAGRAVSFMQLDWVRSQLMELVGIDPFPGTLNLALADDTSLARWRQWRSMPGQTLEPKEAGFCRARCYPVQVAGAGDSAMLSACGPDRLISSHTGLPAMVASPTCQYLI